MDGSTVINIQSAFAGAAGWYLQTDASNAVELDAGGSVLQTVPIAANTVVSMYPMDFDIAYANGGPNGPYIFDNGAWTPVISWFVSADTQVDGTWSLFNTVTSSLAMTFLDSRVETRNDGSPTWIERASGFTQDQLDGNEAIIYQNPVGTHFVRFIAVNQDGCEFTSAVYTFLVI